MHANLAYLFSAEIHPLKILEKLKRFNSLKKKQNKTFQFGL